MRGPQYKRFSKGGAKALFWVDKPSEARRVIVTESAIDALSLATIEGWPGPTACVSTGGGFGPRTDRVLRVVLPAGARLVAATDQGNASERLAERLQTVATTACASVGKRHPAATDCKARLTGGR